MDYLKLLDQVQQYISLNYATELEAEFGSGTAENSRLPEYIRRYLLEHPVPSGDTEALAVRIYNDMARLVFPDPVSPAIIILSPYRSAVRRNPSSSSLAVRCIT